MVKLQKTKFEFRPNVLFLIVVYYATTTIKNEVKKMPALKNTVIEILRKLITDLENNKF